MLLMRACVFYLESASTGAGSWLATHSRLERTTIPNLSNWAFFPKESA